MMSPAQVFLEKELLQINFCMDYDEGGFSVICDGVLQTKPLIL